MRSILTSDIPAGHVKMLYWVRTKHDSLHTASAGGSRIIPARGCLRAARELDEIGDPTDNIPGGHGVTVVWPSGRTVTVRAN